MEKTDVRKASQDAQYRMRMQIVKLRQRGMRHSEIADIAGVHANYACMVYRRHERGGLAGIAKGRRGRRVGEQKLPFALWTRKAVQELIRLRHGTRMPIRTVGEVVEGGISRHILPRKEG
ncbi:MAG: helix-turn-helix domain-containing protein, partial [Deltaproteobacteria bacterium]|nr:helix-turn-helix domain-containing protein [Deltaproteobacteria bacterium]